MILVAYDSAPFKVQVMLIAQSSFSLFSCTIAFRFYSFVFWVKLINTPMQLKRKK